MSGELISSLQAHMVNVSSALTSTVASSSNSIGYHIPLLCIVARRCKTGAEADVW